MEHDGSAYCQAPKLRLGWQLWLGNGWATITALRIAGKDVLIGVDDGRTYRVGYLEAVRCRRVPPAI